MGDEQTEVLGQLTAAITAMNAKLDVVVDELQRLNREVSDLRVDLVDL
jgi:hypothetical protein